MSRLQPFRTLLLSLGLGLLTCQLASATIADSTTITITGQTPGPTVFTKQLTPQASATDSIRSIQFMIAPKPGSVTRPLSGTFSHDYPVERGDLDAATGTIFLPVYGFTPVSSL